jgi:hypothetical protein
MFGKIWALAKRAWTRVRFWGHRLVVKFVKLQVLMQRDVEALQEMSQHMKTGQYPGYTRVQTKRLQADISDVMSTFIKRVQAMNLKRANTS